jgi:hypothetical protein
VRGGCCKSKTKSRAKGRDDHKTRKLSSIRNPLLKVLTPGDAAHRGFEPDSRCPGKSRCRTLKFSFPMTALIGPNPVSHRCGLAARLFVRGFLRPRRYVAHFVIRNCEGQRSK